MNARQWITVILACLAVGTIIFVILTDVWFHSSLVGRGIAIIILGVMVFCVWIGGVYHGMSIQPDDYLTSEEMMDRDWEE